MAGESDALRERYELFSQGDLERALDPVERRLRVGTRTHRTFPDRGGVRERRRRLRSCSKPLGRGTTLS